MTIPLLSLRIIQYEAIVSDSTRSSSFVVNDAFQVIGPLISQTR